MDALFRVIPLVFLLTGCGPFILARENSPSELPPTVRVGIIEDAEEVQIYGEKGLVIDCGGKAIQGEGVYRFRAVESKEARMVYIPVVGTIPVSRHEALDNTLATWRAKGYPVITREVGRRFITDEGFTIDTRVYWVGLKGFRDKGEAEALIEGLYKEGVKGWILEEVESPGQAKIRVFDKRGDLAGESSLPVRIASDSKIVVEGTPYEGEIGIHISHQGRLSVVNEIGLEGYLRGIVPREIDPSSPMEALKAQAVAARGEAISKLGKRHTSSPYDFCAAQPCQVYAGLERQTPNTNQAVAETEGEVLFSKDEIVDAVYHANCGGHTEDNENVWASEPDPALRGVRDLDEDDYFIPRTQIEEWLRNSSPAYCSHEVDKFRWRVVYRIDELNRIVNKVRDAGEIREIFLGERGVSGRLKDIEIIGTKGRFKVYKEYPIRQILGGLRSAAFVLEIKRDENGHPIEFSFIGGGWGHGVGMCQAGAVGMARKEKSYNQILGHYYADTQIKKLY